MTKHIGTVLESSANSVIAKMSFEEFEENKIHLKVGKHLKIAIGNHDFLLVSIKNIKAISDEKKESYLLSLEPVGSIIDNSFIPGSSILPSPTEKVFLADEDIMKHVFMENDKYSFKLGSIAQNKDINLFLDGNSFFSKHIAVVGSTGSGKSCAVSKILQEAVGITDGKNINVDNQKNTHVIIFDIHSEYKSAFDLEKDHKFNLNVLDVEKLKLPYWLMNSEELETLFIESNEQNSHNQVSQFKKAVIANKEKYNPGLKKVTYDTPVYFSIEEVANYIYNMNEENIGKYTGEEHLPKLIDKKLVHDRLEYFKAKYEFIPQSTSKDTKATKGPFHGEFNRFLSRLETKLSDRRLEFLLKSLKEDGKPYLTNDFEDVLKQFMGYLDTSNITIIDLSGVPFEVLSITVSLISRLIFDFAFHYSKLHHLSDSHNDVPFLLVCEEAHNYVPKSNLSDYRASRKSIERIAKEGRKYGLSLMVVSQRPSEVSDTIFAQCNNFIALRLTNSTDQSYIKNLLPNNLGSTAEILPTLGPGECIVVGDSTPLPCVVKLELPNPMPKSDNVKVHDRWREEWIHIDDKTKASITISDVIKRWKTE